MKFIASAAAALFTASLFSCRTPLPPERETTPSTTTSELPPFSPSPSAESTPQPEVAAPAEPAAAAEDNEILSAVLRMNGPDVGRPPNKFRSGHVVKRVAPPARRTATGFEVKLGSAMITTPTVYDRKVLVSGGFNSKEMYAFEAKTGKPVWGITFDDDGPSNPACEEGVCVINTESCTLFALDATTGAQLWSWWLGDPLTSAPTIAKGRVFSSFPAHQTADGGQRPEGATHALAAFDLKKGTQLWDLWLDSDVMSAPVAVGEFVYVTTFAGTVLKVEQATGKIRYAMKAEATSAPVVQFERGVESLFYTRRGEDEAHGAEEMIIRADHNSPKTRYKAAKKKAEYIDVKEQASLLYTLEAAQADSGNGFTSGAPEAANGRMAARMVGVSSVSSMQGFQGSRVLQMGKRNVNTMGDEVVATDAETGAVLWKQKLSGDAQQGGFTGTAPVPAGRTVMYATLSGAVERLDVATGKLVKRYEVGGQVRSQPVVAGGWIYLGTEDGRLVAINTRDATVDGWPTWGGNAQRTGVAAKSSAK